MPVASDSGMKVALPSVQQLKMIFSLCDPQSTGKVCVEHLQELAKYYASEDTKVSHPSTENNPELFFKLYLHLLASKF